MDATLGLPILVGLIAVALLFDFLNGLHDAANSIATIVSTRVLRPQYAVLWAAFFNFVAFVVFGLSVARTIGTEIVDPSVVDAQVIFAALTGAIVWNLITWGLGIPSSSSHALIGGLVGGGMAKAGISAAVWSGLSKTFCYRTVTTGRFPAGAGAGRDCVVGVGTLDTVRGRSRLSHPAVRVGIVVFARTRRQRRAKDHGHYCGAALFGGASSAQNFRSPSGWCWRVRQRWQWAP